MISDRATIMAFGTEARGHAAGHATLIPICASLSRRRTMIGYWPVAAATPGETTGQDFSGICGKGQDRSFGPDVFGHSFRDAGWWS